MSFYLTKYVHDIFEMRNVQIKGITEKYHLYVNFIILYILHILGSPNTTDFSYMTKGVYIRQRTIIRLYRIHDYYFWSTRGTVIGFSRTYGWDYPYFAFS